MNHYSAQMENHISSSQSQSQYQPAQEGIDEAFTQNGEIRSHWKYLIESLNSLGSEAIEERQKKVRRILRGNPNVVALHTTNGRWDLIAELRADNLETFDRVLNGIRKVQGIANTETSILLSTHKA